MASQVNSNAESSDEDLETLYQINESRPPSRESASQSLRSMASPTLVNDDKIEQTIHLQENFVKTRNNKSNKERSQVDNENSKSDGSYHNFQHRENPTSSDVEGDYPKYPLTPTIVVTNSKTKQNEALSHKENNYRYDNRERNPSLVNRTDFVTDKSVEETIQQLTTRIDELTRQIDSQQTRTNVEHLPSRKSSKVYPSQTRDRQDIEDCDEYEYTENHRPSMMTRGVPNLTKSFSTGNNRQARGFSDQPINEQSQVAHRSEFVNDHSVRVSSGGDRNTKPWEKSGRVTVVDSLIKY